MSASQVAHDHEDTDDGEFPRPPRHFRMHGPLAVTLVPVAPRPEPVPLACDVCGALCCADCRFGRWAAAPCVHLGIPCPACVTGTMQPVSS